MRCCCCCPVWLCTLWLALLDLVVVSILFFHSLNNLVKSIDNLSAWTIFGFVFLLLLVLAELVAFVCLVLSKRRVKSHLVIPRLALIAIQIALCVFLCAILMLYFSGWANWMNNSLLDVYEYFTGIRMDKSERSEAQDELRMHAFGVLIVSFMFCIYCLFVLYITRLHQKDMQRHEFHPVDIETQPSQPAHNPSYSGYYQK